jgi:hypothetical protein
MSTITPTISCLTPLNFQGRAPTAATGVADTAEEQLAAAPRDGGGTPSTVVKIQGDAFGGELPGARESEGYSGKNHVFSAVFAADNASGKPDLFGKYASRLNHYMRNFFTAGDKELLGEAYQMAEEKGGKYMEKIDKLAYKLGAHRVQQYMEGRLVLEVVSKTDRTVREVDLAHLEILGEMKKMAGHGG